MSILSDFIGQTKREFDCCWIQSRFSFNVKHQEWRCIRRTSSRRGRNFECSSFARSDYRQQIDSQNSLNQTIRSNFWSEFGLTGKPLCVSACSLYLFPGLSGKFNGSKTIGETWKLHQSLRREIHANCFYGLFHSFFFTNPILSFSLFLAFSYRV